MAVSLEEVVRVLQTRIGSRWEGMEVDGRDEILKVLKKEFNLSTTDADETIDGLIRSGTLRYETGGSGGEGVGERDLSAEDSTLIPPIVPAAPLGTGGSTGLGVGGIGIPMAAGGAGYWRIGNEDDMNV